MNQCKYIIGKKTQKQLFVTSIMSPDIYPWPHSNYFAFVSGYHCPAMTTTLSEFQHVCHMKAFHIHLAAMTILLNRGVFFLTRLTYIRQLYVNHSNIQLVYLWEVLGSIPAIIFEISRDKVWNKIHTAHDNWDIC